MKRLIFLLYSLAFSQFAFTQSKVETNIEGIGNDKILISFPSQSKENVSNKLELKVGTIEGIIVNYDGKIKSGKLTYFDAITRIVHNEIFGIDSLGNFKVSYKIPHSVINTSFLNFSGKSYNLFLEPGEDIKVVLNANSIKFTEGSSNEQSTVLRDTIYKKFKEEIDRCSWLHTKNITFLNYIQEQSNLAKKKLDFINEFEKTHNFSNSVINAFKKEAFYAQAKSWINFRHDYSTGRPVKRDTLIYKNFYDDLFKAFPVDDQNAFVSREYIDYISNIKDVLSENSFGSEMDFIKSHSNLAVNELKLLERVFKKDTAIINSSEFKKFMTSDRWKLLTDLHRKYLFSNILLSCKAFPKGIGRDLIISQGISSCYLNNTFIEPTEEEWKSMDELTESKIFLNYVHDIVKAVKQNLSDNNSSTELSPGIKIQANNLNKSLIGKYKGKVIYVDFWATWCGPCKKEIPDTKVLINQFKGQEFVFVSLCCKSKEQDWKNTVSSDKLEVINQFIRDDEYDLLASVYKVKAFPTYILIDKNGNVVNYNAPRPSSNTIITEQIQRLLNK